jgi:hypothetical protein
MRNLMSTAMWTGLPHTQRQDQTSGLCPREHKIRRGCRDREQNRHSQARGWQRKELQWTVGKLLEGFKQKHSALTPMTVAKHVHLLESGTIRRKGSTSYSSANLSSNNS